MQSAGTAVQFRSWSRKTPSRSFVRGGVQNAGADAHAHTCTLSASSTAFCRAGMCRSEDKLLAPLMGSGVDNPSSPSPG